MPTETFIHSAPTTATPHQVWEALQSPSTWEGIPGVDEVSNPGHDSKGELEQFDFATRIAGRSYQGKATRGESVVNKTMEWAISSSEIRGTVRVTMEEALEGAEITVSLQVSSASMLSSMFFPAIVSSIGTGFPGMVDDFAEGFSA